MRKGPEVIDGIGLGPSVIIGKGVWGCTALSAWRFLLFFNKNNAF